MECRSWSELDELEAPALKGEESFGGHALDL